MVIFIPNKRASKVRDPMCCKACLYTAGEADFVTTPIASERVCPKCGSKECFTTMPESEIAVSVISDLIKRDERYFRFAPDWDVGEPCDCADCLYRWQHIDTSPGNTHYWY